MRSSQEIVDRYSDYPGDKLLPFESSERFNDNIKIIFEKAEATWPAAPSVVIVLLI